jgi:hypothetical protein
MRIIKESWGLVFLRAGPILLILEVARNWRS